MSFLYKLDTKEAIFVDFVYVAVAIIYNNYVLFLLLILHGGCDTVINFNDRLIVSDNSWPEFTRTEMGGDAAPRPVDGGGRSPNAREVGGRVGIAPGGRAEEAPHGPALFINILANKCQLSAQ